MPNLVNVRLLIKGDFSVEPFVNWIFHRAGLLNLSGSVKSHSDQLIEVNVRGEQILVEALEVACSLGPMDAQVDSIEASVADKACEYGQFLRV